MRKIIFRAKRKDNGAWVYGDLTHVQAICSVEEKEATGKATKSVIRVAGYDIDENTIGQLAESFRMSNGERLEIYTGDILYIWNVEDVEDGEHPHCLSFVDEYGMVSWKQECSYHIDDLGNHGYDYNVVGNIYDNFDLASKAI